MIIAKLAEEFAKMFNDKKVAKKMKQTGCGVKVIPRDELSKEWVKIETSLKDVLADLKTK